jgi:hypothetical protein
MPPFIITQTLTNTLRSHASVGVEKGMVQLQIMDL